MFYHYGGYGKDAEFYIGFFKNNVRAYSPAIIISNSETHPVYYSTEAPGIGYSMNGTIPGSDTVILNVSENVMVSSYNDQNNGIYLKISSDKVTVIGQCIPIGYSPSMINPYASLVVVSRNMDNFAIIETIDLHVKEYEYFAVSVNSTNYYSNYYNSTVLIVGTRNNTTLKLTVTQPVTTRVGYINATLVPGREYSFVINRLQTVCLSAYNDLTGTRILTNMPVSVFSGHQWGTIQDTWPGSYLIEQMPPTAIWNNLHFVIPLTSSGYAIKVVAATECVVNFYCNNSINSNTALKVGETVLKLFLNDEICAIQSFSKILVMQFSLPFGRLGPVMTLVPSTMHYFSKIFFSTISFNVSEYNNHYISSQDNTWTHSVNVIVLTQYYQPHMIYLVTAGMNKSLDTEEWMPIKVDNVIKAYGTKVKISTGMAQVIHDNQAALMSITVYGYTEYGGYGTTASFTNKGM